MDGKPYVEILSESDRACTIYQTIPAPNLEGSAMFVLVLHLLLASTALLLFAHIFPVCAAGTKNMKRWDRRDNLRLNIRCKSDFVRVEENYFFGGECLVDRAYSGNAAGEGLGVSGAQCFACCAYRRGTGRDFWVDWLFSGTGEGRREPAPAHF